MWVKLYQSGVNGANRARAFGVDIKTDRHWERIYIKEQTAKGTADVSSWIDEHFV